MAAAATVALAGTSDRIAHGRLGVFNGSGYAPKVGSAPWGGEGTSPPAHCVSLRRRALARYAQRRRVLVLSYDDGPGEDLTPRVAAMLRAASARATFFLLGRQAVRYPDLVELLYRDGHELACHSNQHLHAWKTWPWRVREDIDGGYRVLSPWVPPGGLFRPPFGKTTPFTRRQLRRRGAVAVIWTHDSGDTRRALSKPCDFVNSVFEAEGGVVLLHDFDRDGADRGLRSSFVLEVTGMILEGLASRGLSLCTVGELLGAASAGATINTQDR
jgi:peptidoglycan/xylan/chitin deacetylase (PgdA/CDA1 family)